MPADGGEGGGVGNPSSRYLVHMRHSAGGGGGQNIVPLSLPTSSGKIFVIAVADPVEVGARFISPLRARRRSAFLELGASMMVCVLVTA